VHLATVIDNKDGEGNPGFRVKVKFHWLQEQEKTYWARIAVPMAGAERGTYFLPELEDQILVVFEHGDINRPIMIGAVWNKKQEPVENNTTGKNNTKMIKSKNGHRVVFDDKEGAEKIVIVDKSKKNKIILDSANKQVKIHSSGELLIDAKENIIIHSKTLKMGAKSIKGSAKTVLSHAIGTLNVIASGGLTIGSNVTANVNGGAATTVSGSPTGSLLGTLTTTGTGDWDVFKTEGKSISKVSGVKDLYLVFKGGGGVGVLDSLKFT
jgi:uncharacterized protein involved in type VI secretion and phage assembly